MARVYLKGNALSVISTVSTATAQFAAHPLLAASATWHKAHPVFMDTLDHDSLGEVYNCLVGEDIYEDADINQTELLAEHVKSIATLRTLDKHAAAHLHQRLLDATFSKVWYALKYNERAREQVVREKLLLMINNGSQHRMRAFATIRVLNTHWADHIHMCEHLKVLYKDMSVDAGLKACKAGVRNLMILRNSGEFGWKMFVKTELNGFPEEPAD